jgi:hypothetical protein
VPGNCCFFNDGDCAGPVEWRTYPWSAMTSYALCDFYLAAARAGWPLAAAGLTAADALRADSPEWLIAHARACWGPTAERRRPARLPRCPAYERAVRHAGPFPVALAVHRMPALWSTLSSDCGHVGDGIQARFQRDPGQTGPGSAAFVWMRWPGVSNKSPHSEGLARALARFGCPMRNLKLQRPSPVLIVSWQHFRPR